jgi:hypothetical protein
MPRSRFALTQVGACILLLTACNSNPQNLALGLGIGTVLGGYAPSNEIEQIYYLGAFDPQEQVPPAVYRVRVRGQASFLSFMKFGSGWVPARFIDSLGPGVELEGDKGTVTFTKAGGDEAEHKLVDLDVGRRMIVFGPEGFRVVPKKHRLVIIMGSSPEKFFHAVDQALGSVAATVEQQHNAQLMHALFEAIERVKHERERLTDLQLDVQAELTAREGEPK